MISSVLNLGGARGTLTCLGESSIFAIDELELPVVNALADLEPKEFLCPGSTLHVNVERESPLTGGAPDDLLVIFRNNPAFEVKPGLKTRRPRWSLATLMRGSWRAAGSSGRST
jgi:hypothetical protein